jgi:hypothetical protein
LVAHLGVSYYNDPTQLTGATNTAVPVTLAVNGPQLTITPNAGYTGVFIILVNASDGSKSASETFRVTVA